MRMLQNFYSFIHVQLVTPNYGVTEKPDTFDSKPVIVNGDFQVFKPGRVAAFEMFLIDLGFFQLFLQDREVTLMSVDFFGKLVDERFLKRIVIRTVIGIVIRM